MNKEKAMNDEQKKFREFAAGVPDTGTGLLASAKNPPIDAPADGVKFRPLWRVTSGGRTTLSGLRVEMDAKGRRVYTTPVDALVVEEPAPGGDGVAPDALAAEPVPAEVQVDPPAPVE